MKKIIIYFRNIFISLFIFSTCIFPASAFDWPQEETESNSFYSYFAQLRGGTLSTSLVFGESGNIKTAEEGRILAVIDEDSENSGWFQSTLGNAVIIAHKDNIDSIYANLDIRTIPSNIYEMKNIEKGTPLGTCTDSGWQEGKSCLEFQVIDTKNKTAVNPRILMPRIGKELELNIRNVTAVNKKGVEFPLGVQKIFSAGTYRIYKERQQTAMPYRTIVSVNGAAVETITYDTLIQSNNRLCAAGRTPYSVDDLYPDDKRQLLAEVTFPRGHISLSITVIDILGKEKTLTYNADVY